jgi:phosphotriesterase-related protein
MQLSDKLTQDIVMIATATGEVPADQLGATLMHEHIFVLNTEIELNYPEGWDEEERIADAVRKLNELKRHGIDSVVDLTVIGLGRYIPRIARIAEQTDVNIIVATGLYTYRDLPIQFNFQDPDGPFGGRETMLDMFTTDIEHGIADTGVRAAILKCATDEPGLEPGVVRVLRAVSKVHRKTGVPISTHTHARLRRGLEQQDIFEEEGVDLSRVIIGHSGDTDDLDYLRQLMEAGSYIGMDRFGLDNLLTFEGRVDTVARLCSEGYANRMVLSHDTNCHMRWMSAEALERLAPNWHFLHISDDVLPALRSKGVAETDITEMMVENPRRIFETRGAY